MTDEKVTQVVDGVTYKEGQDCPHCESCSLVEDDDEPGKLVCEGCELSIDGVDHCNIDNGHNCDACDDEYCQDCGGYTVEDGRCTECGWSEEDD